MRNPLIRRLPKELIEELGKYLVIFIFMSATIGFISGFLVADNSMKSAYEEGFDKYRIEDGNFELWSEAEPDLLKAFEEEKISVYPNYYKEEETEKDTTLRIYANREEIDLVCLMEGALPNTKDEIAIDRMYAENNGLKVGDELTVGGRKLSICGLVALSDYSALFSDNNDMMFDAVKFGTAVMTKEGFESYGDSGLHYIYSWKYSVAVNNDKEAKEQSDNLLKLLSSKVQIRNYIPAYLNQAIQFAGDDMGSDKAMMITLLYILIVILAFVFAVTTGSTIIREAAVIGTLRASGYTKGELIRHYMELPLLVSAVAAIAGNIMGYTFFKQIVAGMYYGSYSLPVYQTLWNAEAFVLTTVIPLLIMLLINFLMLAGKLSLSPLRFLRRDLGRRKKRGVLPLPGFQFITRFRIRIIFQNGASYLTLFVGILFANILLLFGMMMAPLLDHFQDEILTHRIAQYQYILKAPTETQKESAEKYAVMALKTCFDSKSDGESISVYGIIQDSRYVNADFKEEGVFVSDGFAEKYSLTKGDSITLKQPYSDESYTFQIAGTYSYPAALSVFMGITEFNQAFQKDSGYFNGYFSQEELTDLDSSYIASTITEDDLTKLSRQMDVSMGDMFIMVNAFAVALFMLLIYLLSKLIIEKNAASISMVKILGYSNREISSLYLHSTSLVVICSLLLSLPLSLSVIKVIYAEMMYRFSGWLSFYIRPMIYLQMLLLGIVSYAVVAVFQFIKIKKVPMEEALKNVE
jgi:putative ABC transport system permease protein